MDQIFQTQQDMTYAERERYEKEKLLQEKQTQEHFMRMDLSSRELMERYQAVPYREAEQTPVQDMPQQTADEKESSFKKRKKSKLQSGAEELNRTYQSQKREQNYVKRLAMRRGKMEPDDQAQAVFENPISADQLTPEYVMNNFAQVRRQLDKWKEHMEVYDAQYPARLGLSRERELRMQQMEKMYQDSENAFHTAIRALGYRYVPDAKAGKQFLDDLTEEERAKALTRNRELRSELKQKENEITVTVADKLLQEEKAYRQDSFVKTPKRAAKLAEIEGLIQEHENKYTEHKESVERICKELYRLLELLENTERDCSDIDSVSQNRIGYEGKTRAYLQTRRTELENKERILRNRAECMEKGLRHVLTESALTQKEMLTLREFLPEEFEESTWEAEDRAVYYARSYRTEMEMRKQQAADREGDQESQEEEPARREELQHMLERLRDFDVQDMEYGTDEDLLMKSKELQDLYSDVLQIKEKKYQRVNAPDGRPFMDAFIGQDKVLFDLRCEMIQFYAIKARGLSMVKAYEQGRLTEECFTDSEILKLHTRFHVGEKAPLTMDHMLIAAKEMLELASASQDAAYNRYFQSDHARERYDAPWELNTEQVHPTYKRALNDMKRAAREALGLPQDRIMESAELLRYHHHCLQRRNELTQRLADQGIQDREPLQQELETLEERMRLLRIEYSLTKTQYRRAGDTQSLLEEPLFRTYDSAESLPVFQNMEDGQFRQMCMLLSAGALEQDGDQPERIEHYYRENLEGLQTYKNCIFHHYEMLEERFHHVLPSTMYILEHEEELQRIFANVQVDGHMVENMPDLLDLTNPVDARLYHLVRVYNGMAAYVLGIGSSVAAGVLDYSMMADALQGAMKGVQDSFEYLGGKWDVQKEEQHQPVIESFRQLQTDAAHILTADREAQLAYFGRAKELQDYIAQHDGDTTMVMRQLRGWLRLAQMRIQVLVKKENPHADADSYEMLYARKRAETVIAEEPFAQLAQRLSLLRLTEEMLTPEYMTSHAEELLTSFQAMDAYQALLKQTPELEEAIPAAQKLAWEKSQSMYERYREYVTTFMRSRCVDIHRGEYLTAEDYLWEKEALQGRLSKEKVYFEDMLGGFRRYAQQVSELSGKVNSLSKIKKQIRGGITKQLDEAEAWLKDLTVYLAKPLVLEPEDFFDATIMTLMSMFGYIEKNLRGAMSALENADGAAVNGLSADIQNIFDVFHTVRMHIPGCAQQLRKDALHTEEAQILTLQDIVLSAQGVKTFALNGGEQNVGAAASDVLRLEEGEKVFFFKEDEILQDFLTTLKEQILALGDAELENKLLDLLEKVKTDDEVRDQLTILHTAVELIMPDGQLNENALAQVNAILALDVRGYIENAENQEKWKNFAKAFKKRFTVEAAITDVGYQLDEGADMTARNFASERVAELFGLKDLITKNHEAVLVTQNGEQKKGFAMEMAEGVSVGTLRQLASDMKYMLIVPGEAQRQLLNLQILDNIIGQVDRHTGNVFVSYHVDDESKQIIVEKVTGIDNDFAFGASEKIGGYNTSSILVQKKKAPAKQGEAVVIENSYLLGVIDKDMYESLLTVTPELLTVNLEGIIEPPYIEALKKRYETLRSSILAAVNADQGIVKTKDEWNEDTRKQMLRYKGESLLIQRLLESQKDQW